MTLCITTGHQMRLFVSVITIGHPVTQTAVVNWTKKPERIDIGVKEQS